MTPPGLSRQIWLWRSWTALTSPLMPSKLQPSSRNTWERCCRAGSSSRQVSEVCFCWTDDCFVGQVKVTLSGFVYYNFVDFVIAFPADRCLLVLNKSDLLPEAQRRQLNRELSWISGLPPVCLISCRTNEGLQDFLAVLHSSIKALWVPTIYNLFSSVSWIAHFDILG